MEQPEVESADHLMPVDQSVAVSFHVFVVTMVVVVVVVVVVQNWKLRWFVLQKNELRYYAERSSPEPIRTMDLRECRECIRATNSQQDNGFSYAFASAAYH